jgi:hypothetical protein
MNALPSGLSVDGSKSASSMSSNSSLIFSMSASDVSFARSVTHCFWVSVRLSSSAT